MRLSEEGSLTFQKVTKDDLWYGGVEFNIHVKIHTLILSYFSLLQKTLKGLSVQSMHFIYNNSFNFLNNPLRFSNNINLIFTVKKTEVQEVKELVTGSEPIQSGFRAYTCNRQRYCLLIRIQPTATSSVNIPHTTLKKYWDPYNFLHLLLTQRKLMLT